jgi:hypothetical protein
MSRSKGKGTAWETAICRFLAEEGFPHVERRALNGTADRGDIAGIPGLVLEAKNCKRMDLAGWVDEAAIEQANDGAEFSAVWHHRVGRAKAEAGYVTMTGATFVRLLRAAGFGGPPSATENDEHPEVVGQDYPAPAEARSGRFPHSDAWPIVG